MKAKKNKWYWIEYKSKNPKRHYIGPAKCINGMRKPYSEKYYEGRFELPSGADGFFYDIDVVRELDKEWVEKNYPSYFELLKFWRTHFPCTPES